MPDERFELLENKRPAERGTRRAEARSLPSDIDETEKRLKELFCAEINNDLVLKRVDRERGVKLLIAYLNGMADANAVNDFILRPLLHGERGEAKQSPLFKSVRHNKTKAADEIRNVVEIAESKTEETLDNAVKDILEGMTAVFIDKQSVCLALETRGFEKRSIGQAENETVVLGPKESFTESMRTNITLIRRCIRLPDLVAEIRPSGGQNNTNLALVYLSGTASPKLVAEVKKRLSSVALKDASGSGMIDQLIEDKHLLPLPRTLSTERPDRAASHIMSGCVCLVMEGSPLVTVLPVTLFSLMNTSEDVYLRRPLGTLLRLTRYTGALISVFLPGYFLAMALYHQGGLSTEVLSTVISSRKMVFEPIAIEMIMLLLVFQLIREAGMRVPGSIGQAIGIIGGLIMGQAAVAANLASSVVLIIVALSGLGNFCIPDYSLQLSAAYFRLSIVIAAWAAGLLGIVALTASAMALLVSQKSFGVPYIAPYSPKTKNKRPFLLRGGIDNDLREDDQNNTVRDSDL